MQFTRVGPGDGTERRDEGLPRGGGTAKQNARRASSASRGVRTADFASGGGGGGARARACLGSFRRAAYVPANRVLRNGAVLTDANAVFTGTSAEALKHPAAPICVLGWNGLRVQRCVSALSV